MRILLFLCASLCTALSQYTSQTYPDPRQDPFTCRNPFPGPLCDPSRILSDEERAKLTARINQLTGVTSNIRNTSPSCINNPGANLAIVVAVIDKIGSNPSAPIDIEKFANNLKRRYQGFQDVGMCDTFVLIVNSRQDRQVFTVAGRDAKISKDTLKHAFERNIGHFKGSHYALGLEGMIEMITSSYSNAHIVQVPSPDLFQGEIPSPSIETETIAPFRAAGLPNRNVQQGKFDELIESVEEEDRVWVEVMAAAIARCGENGDINNSIRSVVEEAMAISVKLISDKRYNAIEEEVDTNKDIIGVRDTAWQKAAGEWITPMMNKYKSVVRAGAQQVCPALNPNRVLTSGLRA